MSFGEAVSLFPLAVALHVVEEWPRFPNWVRRFASPRYTDREYVVTHVVAIGGAIAAVALIRAFPVSWMLFGFLALVFGPGVFCNAFFHIGATVISRVYCPGAITGLLLYLPLSALLAFVGLRDGLFTARFLMMALAVAAPFHALEVGHNVFKRW